MSGKGNTRRIKRWNELQSIRLIDSVSIQMTDIFMPKIINLRGNNNNEEIAICGSIKVGRSGLIGSV